MKPSLKRKITTVALCGLCLWLLLLVIGSQIKYDNGRQQLQAMEDRIAGSERENERLGRELELMRQPDWLALLARARLNLKKAGETVVFVYKTEKPGTISQPQPMAGDRPNWRKWLDWVTGK